MIGGGGARPVRSLPGFTLVLTLQFCIVLLLKTDRLVNMLHTEFVALTIYPDTRHNRSSATGFSVIAV
jgi:hypothetical protein